MDLRCEGTGEAVSFGILDDLLDRVTNRLDERLHNVLSYAEGLEERVREVIDEVFLFFFLWRALTNGLVQGGALRLVAARGGALTAATAAGGTAFLTHLADRAQEGGGSSRDDVEERLQFVECHLQQAHQVLNVRPLNDSPGADSSPCLEERKTKGESSERYSFNGLADNLRDQLAHVIVHLLHQLGGFRYCAPNGGGCVGQGVDRTNNLPLTPQVTGDRFTLHVLHGAGRSGGEFGCGRAQRISDGCPGHGHAVDLRGVSCELVHPELQRINVAEEHLDAIADPAAESTQGELGDAAESADGRLSTPHPLTGLELDNSVADVSDGPQGLVGSIHPLAVGVYRLLRAHFFTPSKMKRRSVRSSS